MTVRAPVTGSRPEACSTFHSGSSGQPIHRRIVIARILAVPPGTGNLPCSASAPVAVSLCAGRDACTPAARRPAIRRWAVYLVAAQLSTISARAGEICHFAGTTDYAGRVAVTTNVSTRGTDGATTVDVSAMFHGTPLPFMHIDYLMQETSTWKTDQLQSVAVNSRYLVDGHIVRQEWDLFDRGTDGLEAYRLQGKILGDIQRKFPAFVRHWDPATFGQPWIEDYRKAGAERRPDLDLPAPSVRPDIRSPLALAFYWSRRIPGNGEAASVFLPGFKRDKRVDLTIAAAKPTHDGQQLWQTSVRYPALSTTLPSIAKASVSADGHLLQLAGSVQGAGYSAYGVIRQDNCEETAETHANGHKE